jgi:prolyl-tRNA synthetase
MFHIEFENDKGEKSLVWQNSWGLTTRTIGVMVMTHSDDKGLILPPRIAPVQVVIVPIWFKEKEEFIHRATSIRDQLRALGIRTEFDDREQYTPGWKFNHWELKGVPVRIEIGPKDLEAKRITVVRRDQEKKKGVDPFTVPFTDVNWVIPAMLENVQASLLANARKQMNDHKVVCRTWGEFLTALDGKNIVMAPWCEVDACEESIKQRSGDAAKQAIDEMKAEGEAAESGGEKLTGAAKSLCMPFDQPQLPKDCRCFACDKPATKWVLWGRSY